MPQGRIRATSAVFDCNAPIDLPFDRFDYEELRTLIKVTVNGARLSIDERESKLTIDSMIPIYPCSMRKEEFHDEPVFLSWISM